MWEADVHLKVQILKVKKMSEFDLILEITTAVFFFGLYSAVYKRTAFYSILANIMVGITAAYTVLGGLDVLQNQLFPRISGGETIYLAAVIIGILYFTALFPRLKGLYRGVTVIMVAVGLGLSLNLSMVKVWDWVVQFAAGAFTGIGPFLAMFFLATGITNFLFAQKLAGPSNVPRQIGRVGLLIYSAYTAGSLLSYKIGMTMFYVIEVVQGNAWWIPFAIFALILIDATGILKRSTKVQMEA